MFARGSKSTKTLGPSGEKPVVGVYSALMFVAFAALVAGCVLLSLELTKYEWKAFGS